MIDIGAVISGKYRLLRLVGDGGMGSVYEAQHVVLGTRVAIKVLHPELAKRTGLVERFLQEARVAAQIRSPHVVQVTDVDRTPEGYAFIVMELLEGEPLSSALERERRLAVPVACEYTLQILSALEAAHALRVIHRDLKPENVFVTFAAGRPVLKLIDFGIAKAHRTDPQQRNLTVAGVVMGTAEYMAPEQARSADKVDARSGLYAVGVMLYEMISGVRPVPGDDARVIALRVERGEIAPLIQSAPDVPRELAGLVHRAMAARPELRFASATEMRLALEKASGPRRASTSGVPMTPATREPAGTAAIPGLPQQQAASRAAAAVSGRTGTGPGGPAAAAPSMDTDAPAHTERAPPMASPPVGAQAAPMTPPTPAYAGVAMPPAPAGEARRGGAGGARLAAMIALPILLGVGAVMVLVATGALSFGSSRPAAPPPTGVPAVELEAGPAIATVTTPTVMTTPPGTLPPLGPTHAPPTGPRPGPAPSSRPSPKSEDAGVPSGPAPSAMPTAPPPFPFPSTFPPIPSVFPTAFPTAFPPWPGVTPPPSPPPAPTSTSGSI